MLKNWNFIKLYSDIYVSIFNYFNVIKNNNADSSRRIEARGCCRSENCILNWDVNHKIFSLEILDKIYV